ncbi:MAG TPA: RNA polymerase sigma factor [Armatimonadota bacterium]|nr:RNA polymerase sigma factor [Armatimonadota bacterium]
MEHCAVNLGFAKPVGRAAVTDDLQSIYREYSGPLYWYALALLERADEAEDVVHDVFAALLRRRTKQAITQLRAYLFTAVRRRALKVRNRRRAEAPAPQREPASWVGRGPDPDVAIDLDRALKELPVEQREIIVLKAVEGLTFREIATLLHIPQNTAASRYRLALSKLRMSLEGGDEDD